MAKKQTKKFLYFAPLAFDTVFKTQVIGWVNVYRQEGLDFEIVKIYSIRRFNLRRKQRDKKDILMLYNGPLSFLHTWPERLPMGRYINVIIFLFLLLKKGIFFKKIVVQIRSASYYKTFRMLKFMFGSRLKVIFDARAAAAEEFLYNLNDSISEEDLSRYNRIKKTELEMVKIADKVFAVSNHLIDYYKNEMKNSSGQNKFVIYPCSADQRYFYFNADIRKAMRKELQLINKFVVVYSGGLAMKWHIPKEIFSFFKKLRMISNNIFFMVLTNDLGIAENWVKHYELDMNDFLIKSVENKEVCQYLNASDLGILIRENHPMNQVASPTKFAEYLMCGLPVAISPAVGDFTEIINFKKWGFLYDETKGEEKLKQHLKSLQSLEKNQIADYGKQHFSKQSRISEIYYIFDSI